VKIYVVFEGLPVAIYLGYIYVALHKC